MDTIFLSRPGHDGERLLEFLSLLIDDFCGWCEVHFMHEKSEVLDKVFFFKATNQTGRKIKALQSDANIVILFSTKLSQTQAL